MERLPPTPRRKQRALAAGDTPLSTAALRVLPVLLLGALSPSLGRALRASFLTLLNQAVARPMNVSDASVTFAARDVLVMTAPFVVTAAVAVFAAGLVQTRGAFVFGTPRWESPRRDGFSERIYEALRGAALTVLIVVVAASALASRATELADALGDPKRTLEATAALFPTLVFRVGIALLAAAVVDMTVGHAFWIARLGMTPHEAKLERREAEGDPTVRRMRREAHERLAKED